MPRLWNITAILLAGVILSTASFLSTTKQDRATEAVRERTRDIRREICSRTTLLDIMAQLLADSGTSPTAVQDILNGYGQPAIALWAPWHGKWSTIQRYASPETQPVPPTPWLLDALRRTATERRTLSIPATAPDGSELLALAAPVLDANGNLKGVAILLSPLNDLIEQAAPETTDLILEDTGLGGRLLYSRISHTPAALEAKASIDFQDRHWTLRISH